MSRLKNKRLYSAFATIWLIFLTTLGQSRDVTFLFTSDHHYGSGNSAAGFIANLNAIPGKAYPAEVGGTVDEPRGVIACGDLTNYGYGDEWFAFANEHGLNGDRLLDFPIYEGFGNHDQWEVTNATVRDAIKERNLLRVGVSNISKNGFHYSWDWDDVHFIQLNLMAAVQIPTNERFDAKNSIGFLESDLAEKIGDSGRPVICVHHCNVDLDDGRWTAEDKIRYAEALQGYNVIAIIHGHTHSYRYYTWHGIDVFNSGEIRLSPNGDYLVVHITDDLLTVIDYNNSSWGPVVQRSIGSPTSSLSVPATGKSNALQCRVNREHLKINVDFMGDYRVSIVGLNGKTVRKQFSGNNAQSYAWEPKSSGVYLVNLQTGKKNFTRKVLIHK